MTTTSTNTRLLTVLLSVLGALLPIAMFAAPATAAPVTSTPRPDSHGTIYFHSPSGRFACAVYDGVGWPQLDYQAGCQGGTAVTNRTERACRTTWGPSGMSMVLNRNRAHNAVGRFVCQNQGVFVYATTDRKGRLVKPVLPYGRSVKAGNVTCTMRTTGVTCRNGRTGHGFTISAQGHRGF